MTNLTPVLLTVILIVFLAVLAYRNRVRLEDLITVFESESEIWTDPETEIGRVLESDSRTWAKSHLCPVCESPSLMVDAAGYFYCDNTDCSDFGDLKYADEIAPSLVSLFYQISGSFTAGLREDYTGEKIRKLEDNAPDWMTEVIHTAHGETLPDDTIYRMVEQVADHLGYADEDSDNDDLRDLLLEIEPDIYTSQLTAWLHARPDHSYYLGQVQEEIGPIEDGFQLLAAAQQNQIQEIGYSMIETLEETREEIISDLDDLADDLSQEVAESEEEE